MNSSNKSINAYKHDPSWTISELSRLIAAHAKETIWFGDIMSALSIAAEGKDIIPQEEAAQEIKNAFDKHSALEKSDVEEIAQDVKSTSQRMPHSISIIEILINLEDEDILNKDMRDECIEGAVADNYEFYNNGFKKVCDFFGGKNELYEMADFMKVLEMNGYEIYWKPFHDKYKNAIWHK